MHSQLGKPSSLNYLFINLCPYYDFIEYYRDMMLMEVFSTFVRYLIKFRSTRKKKETPK